MHAVVLYDVGDITDLKQSMLSYKEKKNAKKKKKQTKIMKFAMSPT